MPPDTTIVDATGKPAAQSDGEIVPLLTPEQEHEAEERTSVTALVVHEAIRKDGDEELRRPVSALAWSGLAAGMSMGFSFLAEALLMAALPASRWRNLIVSLGYPVGFLIVIVGRQQLFTENTLTAVIPLLARRTPGVFVQMLRLWAVVLVSNLAGAHLFAWVMAATPVVRPEIQAAMRTVAMDAADVSPGAAILRGILAGWLIAMVVWMLAAADSERLAIIVVLTYVVGLGGLTHIVVGSVEVLFLVMAGLKSWISFCTGYALPTLLGNIIGGVSLVSALNHAQVIAGSGGRGAQTGN